MGREIKIYIDLENEQYNIKKSINEYLESIDFEKEDKNNFKEEKIKIIFVNKDNKDVTSEWKSNDSYKMIKNVVIKIINLQFKHYDNFKNKFDTFIETINEMKK